LVGNIHELRMALQSALLSMFTRMRSEILIIVKTSMLVFWVATPHGPAAGVPGTRLPVPVSTHGCATQKSIFDTYTTVGLLEPTWHETFGN
jgi:hypothetical protein